MTIKYQEAIGDALVSHKIASDKFKTIPERLLTIHPKELYKEMPLIFMDCETVQRKVLEEILLLGRSSAYAKDNNLVNITDLASWRKTAVISTYDDYLPYIKTEMNGQKGQLYSRDTVLYIATTGSTGRMKYYPESKAGDAAKQLVMAIRGMYMSDLLPVTLDMTAKNLTISSYASVGESKDGIKIVRASGQTARNMRKKTGTMNILPVEFWEAPGISMEDRDYMMCVYALAEERFSKVFCNNLMHFGRLLDRIALQGKSMIEDIRKGEFSVLLTEEVRSGLASTLVANDKRATLLQRIYNRSNSLITSRDDIERIWPQLSMVLKITLQFMIQLISKPC